LIFLQIRSESMAFLDNWLLDVGPIIIFLIGNTFVPEILMDIYGIIVDVPSRNLIDFWLTNGFVTSLHSFSSSNDLFFRVDAIYICGMKSCSIE